MFIEKSLTNIHSAFVVPSTAQTDAGSAVSLWVTLDGMEAGVQVVVEPDGTQSFRYFTEVSSLPSRSMLHSIPSTFCEVRLHCLLPHQY
jgi:hypothetical protein